MRAGVTLAEVNAWLLERTFASALLLRTDAVVQPEPREDKCLAPTQWLPSICFRALAVRFFSGFGQDIRVDRGLRLQVWGSLFYFPSSIIPLRGAMLRSLSGQVSSLGIVQTATLAILTLLVHSR